MLETAIQFAAVIRTVRKGIMAPLQSGHTDYGNRFVAPNGTELAELGKKPRIRIVFWYGLRHLYFQENQRRLRQARKRIKRRVEHERGERIREYRYL